MNRTALFAILALLALAHSQASDDVSMVTADAGTSGSSSSSGSGASGSPSKTSATTSTAIFSIFAKAIMGTEDNIAITSALATDDLGILLRGTYNKNQLFVLADPSGNSKMIGEVTGDSVGIFPDATAEASVILATNTEMARYAFSGFAGQISISGATCENWTSIADSSSLSYFCNSGVTILGLDSKMGSPVEITLELPDVDFSQFTTSSFMYDSTSKTLNLQGSVGNVFYEFEIDPTLKSITSSTSIQFANFETIGSQKYIKLPTLNMNILVTCYGKSSIAAIAVDTKTNHIFDYVRWDVTGFVSNNSHIVAIPNGFAVAGGAIVNMITYGFGKFSQAAQSTKLDTGTVAFTGLTPCANDGENYFLTGIITGGPTSVKTPGIFIELPNDFTFPPIAGQTGTTVRDISSVTVSPVSPGDASTNPSGVVSYSDLTKDVTTANSTSFTIKTLAKSTIMVKNSLTVFMSGSFATQIPPAKTEFSYTAVGKNSKEYFYLNPSEFGDNCGNSEVCQLVDGTSAPTKSASSSPVRYSLVEKFGEAVVETDLVVESSAPGTFTYICYGLFSSTAEVSVK